MHRDRPEPREPVVRARCEVRLPRSAYDFLIAKAERRGVHRNKLVTTLVAGGLRDLREIDNTLGDGPAEA